MPKAIEPKLTVKSGVYTFEMKMTKAQAMRIGRIMMPLDLKAAGFVVEIFTARMEVNDWDGYRINFVKYCGPRAAARPRKAA